MIEKILGRNFLKDYFAAKYYYQPNLIKRKLFSINELEELLNRPVFLKQHAVYLRSKSDFSNRVAQNLADVEKSLSLGYSIHIRNLERALPNSHPLNLLMMSLENYLEQPAESITCIFSPPHQEAFRPHHDQTEIFTVQLEGTKHWDFFHKEDTDRPAEYQLKDLKKTKTIIMKPNNLLYIPKGYVHNVQSLDSYSLSIAFVFNPITTISIYRELFKLYLDSCKGNTGTLNKHESSIEKKRFGNFNIDTIERLQNFEYDDFKNLKKNIFLQRKMFGNLKKLPLNS